MYASVRTYSDAKDAKEVARRAKDQFVPMLKDVAGFRGYFLIDGEGGTITTVTLFDSREAAQKSAERARSWVASALPDLAGGAPPVAVAGEVLLEARA
jgi:hypothetical protein